MFKSPHDIEKWHYFSAEGNFELLDFLISKNSQILPVDTYDISIHKHLFTIVLYTEWKNISLTSQLSLQCNWQPRLNLSFSTEEEVNMCKGHSLYSFFLLSYMFYKYKYKVLYI